MENSQTDAHCSNCGAARGIEQPRLPCPECGETAVTISKVVTAKVVVGARYAVELTPASQDRDWRQRWIQIQQDLDKLLALRTDAHSSETIHAARHQLHSFYIQAYGLKDALKADCLSLGVKPEDIETAVRNDANLAFLADLANLDKHGNVLSKSPRSGFVPKIAKMSGVSDSDSGWRLSITIKHGSRSYHVGNTGSNPVGDTN